MGRMSDRFYTEISGSHTVISYVNLISHDQEVIRLPALEGEVDVDRTAAIRRKLTVKCIDPTGALTPREDGEILTPGGAELHAYRGVRYADGTEEVAPLGVFRLSSADVSESNVGSPAISLEAYDRSRTISRDKFKTPYTVAAGTNLLDAIKDIVKLTLPEVTYDAISTPVVTAAPLLFEAGSDPWEAISDLARSMGCEIYFDAEGVLCILPPNDINALPQPEFSYIEGSNCVMLGLERKYSDENGYNGVIITGESVGDDLPPVRGEAWDENPTSPTYRYGPYGEVPKFETDQNAKTEAQAQQVAQTILAGLLGRTAQISITAGVNPAYEAGDVVQVTRERSAVDGLYSVDAFNVPLAAASHQSLTFRELRPA